MPYNVYRLLRNARAAEEAVALTPVSSLVFRNKQPVAATGQIMVATNVSKGNHYNPQLDAG